MKKIINLFSMFFLITLLLINGKTNAQNILPIDTLRLLEGFGLTNTQVRYTTGLQTTPQGNIYISFPRIGLAAYTPPQSSATYGTWELFNKLNTSNILSSDTLHCIYYDSLTNNLWIVHNLGVTRKNSFGFYTWNFNTQISYPTSKINDIVSMGTTIYLASNSGLISFNSVIIIIK